MPPDRKLSVDQIAVFEKWVKIGVPFPRVSGQSVSGIDERIELAKQHWAFKPLMKAAPPTVRDSSWPRNEIDRFILSRLEEKGLEPANAVEPALLIRRVTVDLTGLPPSPSQIAEFVANPSHENYEAVIDRLLESPHYGERWGRHWLDLARYADSSGFHNDLDRPWAWKYRDYVIQSFNDDKPYPQFVAEQLAGDEVEQANESTLIATGFCRNGPSNDDNMGKTAAALKQYRADQLDDVISTTGAVFLGITIGCARCHDHKTEPFTAKDYYSLLAIFNGTQRLGSAPESHDLKESKEKPDPKLQIQALIETSAKVPTTHVMRRGIATNLGDEVGAAVPLVLALEPVSFPTPDPAAKSSLRRRTLAAWMTSPENALSWRVLANRIWQHHFGRGIVATPSNFGFTGARPTHPELLDFLAAKLIENGGRWKPLHKLILVSSTYRQASRTSEKCREIDPDNMLFGRMNLRRMEAEVVRDSILVASSNLNPKVGGPGIKPRLPADLIPSSQRNKWPIVKEENSQHWRRSVYIYSKRQLLMPIMELLDAPTTTDSCAIRSDSVVPTQALVLMNDEFVEAQAGFLAQRALNETSNELDRAVKLMFEIVLGKQPDKKRLQQSVDFVKERAENDTLQSAFTDLAHVLFNSSEFIHIQ